ncbi:MAG: diguanylate cyclase domain-containing protein [Betaproteobacteria bacterium]
MARRAATSVPAWVVEQWPDAVLIADMRGRIAYVNRAFESLTGYRRREVIGRTPAMLKSGEHSRGFYRRLWRRLRKGEAFRGVFLNRKKSGELFHEEEIIRPMRGPGGRVTWLVSAGRDVSARVREHRRLEHAATHDALTGLPNRRLYLDRLTQAIHSALRRKERFAVGIVDLDRFKTVNTRFGHAAGDAVLRSVGRRSARLLRAVDTVARVGGDEFAIIIAGPVDRAAVTTVLEKLRAGNARYVRYAGRRIPATISIGVAMYPAHARQAAALLRRADAAMYAAKKAGGNRWRFAGQR